MTVNQELRRVRGFYWGAIYVSDADADFDPDRLRGDGPVWAAPDHVTIAAVCSRTVDEVDADVEVVVRVRDEPITEHDHEVVVEVASGVLNIGDADDSDDIRLGPGKWRLQITVDRPQEPSNVEINISPG